MIKAILLDIEGTTTPVDFVHKKLFPFAEARIKDFVRKNFADLAPEIQELEDERRNFDAFTSNFGASSPDLCAEYLIYLCKLDRKSTPLKSIQGKIWQAGYESGELRSELFDDVPPAFERWKTAGKTIAIYSSGSILAQKLLFRHTDRGDLTSFISNYFDTNIGGKKEPESYRRIAAELELIPENLLFVSDMIQELDAARRSGLKTTLSIREGHIKTGGKIDHPVIRNFDELLL